MDLRHEQQEIDEDNLIRRTGCPPGIKLTSAP